MQKVKVVINQTVRRYNVSHKGIKFSSATNIVGVGKSAYDIYKETTTDNPILNESDWIDSLYGQDGVTPTIGPNGNWFIGDTDTGTVAAPENTVPEKPYFNVPMKCPIPYVGLESEIEDGWSLCDGRNVVGYGLVPDMRGRFIVGADPRTASIPTNSDTNLKNYGAVGNTGGVDKVLLTGDQSGVKKHWHYVFKQSNEDVKFLRDDKERTAITDGVSHYSDNNNMYAMQSSLEAANAGRSSDVSNSAATEAHENRPPYYVVAFIIRTTYQNANGGKSAYDIAKLNGFVGTEAEWLTSLRGKSAYQIALDYGFTGSIEQWILSLKGISGNDGRGIVSIARTSGNGAAGTTDTYTISYSNSTTSTYQVVNGANGSPGTNGRGITSITRTAGNGASGTTDTYTVLFTDNSTTTFNVVNGSNGTNGSSTETAPYVLSGVDADIEIGQKVSHTMPEAHSFTASDIYLESTAAPTDFAIEVDVKKNGVSIFTTKPKINAGSLHLTAAPVLVTTPTLYAVGDLRTVSVEAIGSTETGKNLVLSILMHK